MRKDAKPIFDFRVEVLQDAHGNYYASFVFAPKKFSSHALGARSIADAVCDAAVQTARDIRSPYQWNVPEWRLPWTVDPETKRDNSSPRFLQLCEVVASMIKDGASSIVNGQTDAVARSIVATLAHEYGLYVRNDG